MEQSDYSTIRVTADAKKTWDEFLRRTHTTGTEAFSQFMGELSLLLDLMSPERKLLFMFNMNHEGTNRFVILRLSDSFYGIVTPTKEMLEKFDYSVDKDGHVVDKREVQRPEPPKEGEKQ